MTYWRILLLLLGLSGISLAQNGYAVAFADAVVTNADSTSSNQVTEILRSQLLRAPAVTNLVDCNCKGNICKATITTDRINDTMLAFSTFESDRVSAIHLTRVESGFVIFLVLKGETRE